jgi:hypothetical protein
VLCPAGLVKVSASIPQWQHLGGSHCLHSLLLKSWYLWWFCNLLCLQFCFSLAWTFSSSTCIISCIRKVLILFPHLLQDNEFVKWYRVGSKSMLAVQDDLLVEYDINTASPIGLVCKFAQGESPLSHRLIAAAY